MTPLDSSTGNSIYDGRGSTHSQGRGEVFHDWFPYLEGFSPGFVAQILSHKFSNPENLLDPFCGVGTTPLTIAQMGISCGYCEVNPFLLELVDAKSKTMTLTQNQRQSLISNLSILRAEIDGSINKINIDEGLAENYLNTFGGAKYFSKENMNVILRLKSLESKISNNILKSFFRIIVSSCLLECSLLKRSGDVRYKTKKELSSGVPDILDLIEKRSAVIKADIIRLPNNRKFGDISMLVENAKELEASKGAEKFDGVITSPPYLNGTNYIRNTKLELWYLGYLSRNCDLRKYRDNVVTSAINDVSRDSGRMVIEEAKYVVENIRKNCYDQRIPQMVAAYFHHMKIVAKGIYKVVKKNAPVCIDIGDSIYGGEHVPTHDILADVFNSVGFKIEDEVVLRKRHSNNGTPLTQKLLCFRR